ncbi:coil containing protein [Vibrio phage 1.031.O._10N.261.46.F8]|nr:coil containing protein [Vibrio phage 1.031.O._10N.261.46.F8]
MTTKMHEAALAAQSGTATPEQLDLLVQITDPSITGQYHDAGNRIIMRELTRLYEEGEIEGKKLTEIKMLFSQWDDDVVAWKETLIKFMKLPWKDPAAAEEAYRHLSRLGEDHLLGEIQRDMDTFEKQVENARTATTDFASGVRDSLNEYVDSVESAMKSACTNMKLG